ncbi:MAG: hypothetical protein JWN66_338 [Sphingomonas bacterium]|jgi:hypothetical protein|uniref:hypothetical protein n=1 Tax=Sphingomonas bacterium TaxID=1895847 RepID=UPI0026070FD1|nr:hypothetical protein [Sphingomonas bacterium]MDB5703222.1 hypothetical protein [Sphingomonas bacterium]
MTGRSNIARKIEVPDAPLTDEDARERLEEVSSQFAREPAESSDALLDSLTSEAIKERRLQDATFWQRVKFRSRMLRAIALGRGKARS